MRVGGEEGGRTVRLLDLQDGVAPSEGERKFCVRMENCLPIVVKHRDIPVRVVKFLALLPLMDVKFLALLPLMDCRLPSRCLECRRDR